MSTIYTVHTVTSTRYAVIAVMSYTATGRFHSTRTVAWHDTMGAAVADAKARNAA